MAPPLPAKVDRVQDFTLEHRLALRCKEAAWVTRISVRTLGEILPELPHLHVGRRVLIPVGPLRVWLEEKANSERRRSDAIADEVLQAIRESNDD